MLHDFPNRVAEFIRIANRNGLKMLLVGGGAVNYYGYQRHSADIDFWVDPTEENMNKLLKTLQDMNYSIMELPGPVMKGEQNISIKISPVFELELITRFNPGKSFDEAFANSEQVENEGAVYRVIGFEDLINSKISSERPKDQLDVAELHRIRLRRRNG